MTLRDRHVSCAGRTRDLALLGVVLVMGCSVDVGKLRVQNRDAARDIPSFPGEGGDDVVESGPDTSVVAYVPDTAGSVGDGRGPAPLDGGASDVGLVPDMPLGDDLVVGEAGGEVVVIVRLDAGVESAIGGDGAVGTGGATETNLALTAIAYRWSSNNTATANTNRYAAPCSTMTAWQPRST